MNYLFVNIYIVKFHFKNMRNFFINQILNLFLKKINVFDLHIIMFLKYVYIKNNRFRLLA